MARRPGVMAGGGVVRRLYTRLSARFAEWMMALPDGWVTDVPGLTRNQQLHAIGNGVTPLQAVAALRHLGNPIVWKDAA